MRLACSTSTVGPSAKEQLVLTKKTTESPFLNQVCLYAKQWDGQHNHSVLGTYLRPQGSNPMCIPFKTFWGPSNA